MTDFITLTCPSCGGKMHVTKDIDRFTCEYCGSEHILKNNAHLLKPEPINYPTNAEIKVGDVLISHKQGYHHVVFSIEGNMANILWLERAEGEPIPFYHYPRKINIANALSYYEHVPACDVNRANYKTPKNGWPR